MGQLQFGCCVYIETDKVDKRIVKDGILKDPVLPIVHCTLRSLGGHFCDVKNSEAFV